jgi:hypothetical protein
LYLLDIVLRAGDPKCVTEIKANCYRLKTLETFSFQDDGSDKGTGVSDKARTINKLLNDPELLEEERATAKNIRTKLSGSVGTEGTGLLTARGSLWQREQ